MKTNFTIKNFRVFDENGVDIELAPITILTGKNSAGKSSVVKAVTLLDSFLKQVKWAKNRGEEIRLADYKIDFTIYPNSLLGGFDKVLHRDSRSKQITFEYTVHSLMLSEDVRVEFVFGMGEKDLINNGYLQDYHIKTLEGEIIYSSSSKEGSWINLNLIKSQFMDFVLAEYAVHSYNSIYVDYDIEHKYSQVEYEKLRSAHIEQLDAFNKQRRDDTYKYVRKPYSSDKPIFRDCELSLEEYNWCKENHTFFHIPVVEDSFGKMSKEEIYLNIEELTKDAQLSKSEKKAIDLFLNDFKSSKCDSIKKYIDEKEYDCMEKFVTAKRFSTQAPELVDAGQMSIFNRDSILWGYSTLEQVDLGLPSEKEDNNKNDRNSEVCYRIVFEALMLINAIVKKEERNRHKLADTFSEGSKLYTALSLYASRFIEEVLFPEWADTITYVSTGRVEMNRVYKLDGHDDFSKMLKEYLEAKYKFERNNNSHKGFTNKNYVPDSFMNKWIQDLELGHSVTVEREPSGYGVYVKLHKTENDEGVVLADEGYGITQLVSILLSVETVILSNNGLDVNRYYGMSSLDRFDDSLFHYAQRTIAVEEPEIHLHPAFQSLLADMFASASEYNIHFIVETHSEYLIRKSQVLVAQKDYLNDAELKRLNPFNVIYIDGNSKDDKLYELEYETTGGFKRQFGPGFYNEAADLDMVIIRKEKSIKKFDF